jgi:hypothetical protein
VRPSPPRSASAIARDEPLLYAFPTPKRTGISLPYRPRDLHLPSPAVDISASPPMVVRSYPRRITTTERESSGRGTTAGRAIGAGTGPAPGRLRSPPTSSSSSASSSRDSSPSRRPSADTSAATSVAPSRSPSPGSTKKSKSHSSAETVSIRLYEALQHDFRLGSPTSRRRAGVVDPAAAGQKRRPMHAHALLARSPVAAPRVSTDVACSYRPSDEGLMRKTAGSPVHRLATYAMDPMQARGRRRPGVP